MESIHSEYKTAQTSSESAVISSFLTNWKDVPSATPQAPLLDVCKSIISAVREMTEQKEAFYMCRQ